MSAKRAYCRDKRKRFEVCQRDYLIATFMGARSFEENSHRRCNVGLSLWDRIQNTEYGIETPLIDSDVGIKGSVFCEKGDANYFGGSKGKLENCLEMRRTINSARYSALLAKKLLFVLLWRILLMERSYLHCKARKKNGAIELKLWSITISANTQKAVW